MRDSSRLDRIADAYRIHIQQVGQELRSRTFCWTSAAAAALRLVGLLDLASSATRVRAVLFGIGAALVLDEFALILNLADVYWAPQGRESIDGVVIFTAALVIVAFGGNFWRAAWHELIRGERALARRS